MNLINVTIFLLKKDVNAFKSKITQIKGISSQKYNKIKY